MSRRLTQSLAACVGVAALVAFGVGLHQSAAFEARRSAPQAPPSFTASTGMAHGQALREGVDPLAPPGLPSGASIDPESGRIVGWTPGDTEVVWARWRDLGADLTIDDTDALPAAGRALAEETVFVVGFVLPLHEVAAMREFLVVGSHLACCYGTWPGPGGMVEVRLAEEAQRLDPQVEPVRVEGRLRLRPVYDTWRGARRLALAWVLDEAQVSDLSD